MLDRRPFLSNDLGTVLKSISLLNCIMDLGAFQQVIQKLGNKVLPAPIKGEKLQL
jgi:hypothetical protein